VSSQATNRGSKAGDKEVLSEQGDRCETLCSLERNARFVTMDKLEEIAHDMDTNMNEGFNNICTWFAPKNKVYAGTVSLPNRIALALCINSMGVMPFYTKLFHRLGITMTDNVDHYLRVKETQKMKQIERGKSKEGKKKRSQMKYDRLKQATVTAKMERHKRAGTYRKGMNMDDPYGELLNGKDVDERKTAAKRKAPSALGLFCEWCGNNDHRTKRHKKCTAPPEAGKKYRKTDGTPLANAPAAPAALVDDHDAVAGFNDAARETDRFDSLPFDHQFDDDDDSLNEYFDAMVGGEMDDDDEVEVVRDVI
jgi:hypothetical protein